jgi:hypothetical protein
LPDGDFPNLSWAGPVFSQRAWDLLGPLIASSVEALPIIHPSGKRYYIINVLDVIDCLELERCETNRNSGSLKDDFSAIYVYAFKEDMIRDKHIFKAPQTKYLEEYVSEEFKRVVEKNGLVGLAFRQIYPPPSKPSAAGSESPLPAIGSSPVAAVETPIDPELLVNFDTYRRMAWKNLSLDQYAPVTTDIVWALDRFIDLWREKEARTIGHIYDTKPEQDEIALCVGIVWADQFVKELGWEWANVSLPNQPAFFGVVSPDRAYVIYPSRFVQSVLRDPSLDNTLLLIFNMATGYELPISPPGAYLTLTDGQIRHLVPKK